VPHVGHRTAPGFKVSPHVEQRIVFARESFVFNFGPYEASAGKIQAHPELDGPYSIRMILTFSRVCGELAPPASPPNRSVVEPPAAGFTM
jgi:hypothetical protein